MADDVARAVGAGSNTSLVINGKTCKIRPLTIKELAEVERDCLKKYRRSYLSTYAENIEFLPENVQSDLMEKKMEEAARWDVSDLPTKPSHDPGKVKMTPELRKHLEEDLDLIDSEADEAKAKRLGSIALDQGLLSDVDYQKLTGEKPKLTPINYAQWWISSSFEGRIALITACLSPCGVSEDEIIESMREDPAAALRIASDIEALSTPKVGNG